MDPMEIDRILAYNAPSKESFSALSSEEKRNALTKLRTMTQMLQEKNDQLQEKIDQMHSEWTRMQSENNQLRIEAASANEKERLINAIEDLESSLKLQSFHDDRTVISSDQYSLAISEVVTTSNLTITDLQHLPSCDPLHFYIGKYPTGTEVFLKLYVDPSYDESGSFSVDSNDSKEFEVSTTLSVLRNLRNEVRIMSRLFNDHIVLYYNEIDMGAIYGYAMQLCRGGTLHDLIETHGPLPLDEVRTLMRQMLEALKYLAEERVVHRDVKTANILVFKEHVYKLCDFGSAFALPSSSRDTIINDGQYVGTAQFIAPESGRGMQRGRSDVWSLGCCFYEALTGREPWEDLLKKCQSRDSMVVEIMNQKKPPMIPSEIWSGLDETVRDFYRRIFEFDETKRPTAAQLLQHPFLAS